MTTRRACFALAAALALAASPGASQTAGGAPPERDRQSILAMAGDYRVRFDMRETVAFVPGYKPLEPKLSGGFEAVRVIEDRPGFISLQHLLVVDDDGEPMVIKHWRQDWTWQPSEVLTYSRSGIWRLTPVPAETSRGAWAQTVWQTDDSPRYGGVGRWRYDGGVARWTSEPTLRPLARRDAIRKPPYGWYVGQNRHALTPDGWAHEQDNAKVGMVDGRSTTFVHEVVLNTYARSSAFPIAAADAYWTRTKGYWAEVRRTWDEAARRGGGLKVREEASNGSVTGPKLMGLADEIAEGKLGAVEAAAQARAAIARETGAALASR